MKTAKFKSPKVVHNQYKYRYMVDDHNARRQSLLISLEENWTAQKWSSRVFAFILGVSEVNATLAEAYSTDTPHSIMLGFRKQLAKELIYNTYEEDANGVKI